MNNLFRWTLFVSICLFINAVVSTTVIYSFIKLNSVHFYTDTALLRASIYLGLIIIFIAIIIRSWNISRILNLVDQKRFASIIFLVFSILTVLCVYKITWTWLSDTTFYQLEFYQLDMALFLIISWSGMFSISVLYNAFKGIKLYTISPSKKSIENPDKTYIPNTGVASVSNSPSIKLILHGITVIALCFAVYLFFRWEQVNELNNKYQYDSKGMIRVDKSDGIIYHYDPQTQTWQPVK